MAERPLIGITTSFKDGKQILDVRYSDAVLAAGGLPFILPAIQDPDAASPLVAALSALIITGGPAITRGLLGPLPEDLSDTDPRRVASDNLYLDAWTTLRRPTLGICYGMQLLNARAGGTIHADVQASLEGSLTHSHDRGGRLHPMEVDADSALASVIGAGEHQINTYHVQAVASIGEGYRVVGRAPDGVVEAIESSDGLVMGLQFHPERQLESMLPVFQDLVRRAAEAT